MIELFFEVGPGKQKIHVAMQWHGDHPWDGDDPWHGDNPGHETSVTCPLGSLGIPLGHLGGNGPLWLHGVPWPHGAP